MRRRRPSSALSDLPRFSRSASRSISSSSSSVSGVSNSLTVHFTWRRTSSRSSTLSPSSFSPLYKSINSFARVVKGVCTEVTVPSESSQSFGALINSSCLDVLRTLLSLDATVLRRSIVWTNLISLRSKLYCAACFSSLVASKTWILFDSVWRQVSSSSYRTSKSSTVRGCMRRSISFCRRISRSAARRLSSASACSRLSSSSPHSLRARVRANIPRA
mmetsp:Transcript_2586/g.6104  ORF Transcript_2586/g.6104 Transcript_2586/m.6104 type:complete len:218 (+) Transcript_2586:315-968(+)